MTPPDQTDNGGRRPTDGSGAGRGGGARFAAAGQLVSTVALERELNSQAALARAVLVFICASWFCLLAIGCASYEGEPVRVKPKDLPLAWFDAIFRRTGSMLLLALWAARAAVSLAAPRCVDAAANRVWVPGALYAGQAALRAGVYLLHSAGEQACEREAAGRCRLQLKLRWYLFPPTRQYLAHAHPGKPHHPPHVMSDHILLAAVVAGGVACEAVLPLVHWPRLPTGCGGAAAPRAARTLARVHSAAAVALATLVSAESYYTARYFHPPGEIVYAAVLGAVLFQAPLVTYAQQALAWQRARLRHGGAAEDDALIEGSDPEEEERVEPAGAAGPASTPARGTRRRQVAEATATAAALAGGGD
eukprot:scaffold4.g4968.t1